MKLNTADATNETTVTQDMHLIVYPARDLDAAKRLFGALIGTEPYVDAPYYVGYRTGDLEIGLDPHGQGAGPIAYWAVNDVRSRLAELVAAGGEIVQDVRDVGGGLLIAQVRDASGSTIGLRQSP
jgi:predicted enzyme related to lactoylglutathione lyase